MMLLTMIKYKLKWINQIHNLGVTGGVAVLAGSGPYAKSLSVTA